LIELRINNQLYQLDVDEDTPLLWVLRDELNLKGTKYACGISVCGACNVLVDGQVVRSCVHSIDEFVGKDILTIEGLSSGDVLHYVQQAWIDLDVSECGYCQSGQIISVVELLSLNPSPTDEEIISALSMNLCRCGTYNRIFDAVKHALALKKLHEVG